MHPQLRDLVTRYRPRLLWADGGWSAHSDYWQSRRFLSWLFRYTRFLVRCTRVNVCARECVCA